MTFEQRLVSDGFGHQVAGHELHSAESGIRTRTVRGLSHGPLPNLGYLGESGAAPALNSFPVLLAISR